ncbi:MAG: Undecaprenyl-diphosphatase [Chlamydiae bacterium]|nr:Undecaprenyl-diphosphatase [Chlamydiota bacterium]
MSLLAAIILGIVQGLTEFFPISSSAHLELAKLIFGMGKVPVMFDLACHLGTLAALTWFFKTEILRLFAKDRGKLSYLFIALLPLIPCYFLLAPLRKLVSEPQFLGFFLMLTGGILLLGQKVRVKKRKGLLRDVLLIGTMQAAALIPGISRSASTISAAQVLGWNSKDAVRFSFLLAIPTIIGGNLLEMQKLWRGKELQHIMNHNCLVGFAVAFLVGMLVIRFAISWLEKGNLKLFAWYCLGLGILANLFLFVKL